MPIPVVAIMVITLVVAISALLVRISIPVVPLMTMAIMIAMSNDGYFASSIVTTA
jgi:hypothetical protein